MGKIKCIIVEGKREAQEVLTSYLSRMLWLELRGSFKDGFSALDWLNTNEADLVIVDTEIPGLNGIDFLKAFKKLPLVIITSIDSTYALDAFELGVQDYVIKPLSFERILKAVNKILSKLGPSSSDKINGHNHSLRFAFFNVCKKMVKVDFIEILFVESMREYVYIHTSKEKVITKMTIGEMEELLGPGFIRVHRSFIVNAAKITAYTSEDVFIDKVAVPVGPNYRDSLRTVLGNWSNGMLLTS